MRLQWFFFFFFFRKAEISFARLFCLLSVVETSPSRFPLTLIPLVSRPLPLVSACPFVHLLGSGLSRTTKRSHFRFEGWEIRVDDARENRFLTKRRFISIVIDIGLFTVIELSCKSGSVPFRCCIMRIVLFRERYSYRSFRYFQNYLKIILGKMNKISRIIYLIYLFYVISPIYDFKLNLTVIQVSEFSKSV